MYSVKYLMESETAAKQTFGDILIRKQETRHFGRQGSNNGNNNDAVRKANDSFYKL